MVGKKPKMDPVAGLKAFLMVLPQIPCLIGNGNGPIVLSADLPLGMEGEQFLDQHMMAELRIQCIRVPAFIDNGIGALTGYTFNMAGHSRKGENGMKFQRYTVIHRKSSFSLFLAYRIPDTPAGICFRFPEEF
jgi:hypothetical protein